MSKDQRVRQLEQRLGAETEDGEFKYFDVAVGPNNERVVIGPTNDERGAGECNCWEGRILGPTGVVQRRLNNGKVVTGEKAMHRAGCSHAG